MEEITLVLLIALIVILIFLGLSWISLARTSEPTNIPGPRAWPVIGNAGYFLGVNNVETLEAFAKTVQVHDAPLNRLWLGPKLIITVNSPKYVEALLTHKAAATRDEFLYRSITEATGNGVFSRNGEEWKRMRRPMMNMVLPKNIDNFHEILCQQGNSLCQDLDVKVDQEPFDISPYIKFSALALTCETMMGISNVEYYMPEGRFDFIHRIEREIENVFVNMLSYQGMLGLSKYSSERIQNYSRPFFSKILDKRRKQLDLLGTNIMTEQPKIYVDVVLQTAEIERLNEHEAPILLADVMTAGAALVFTLFLILKDPRYWERPKEFFPDHFLPEAVAKRPKGTFIPFAAGPRMCPGQQYSFLAMKTVLSTLLRKFRFTTDQKYSELKYKYLLMREPVNTFVKLLKRPPLTKSNLVSS